MFQTNFIEKKPAFCVSYIYIYVYIYIYININYAVYEMMWKNDAEPDRPPMTI